MTRYEKPLEQEFDKPAAFHKTEKTTFIKQKITRNTNTTINSNSYEMKQRQQHSRKRIRCGAMILVVAATAIMPGYASTFSPAFQGSLSSTRINSNKSHHNSFRPFKPVQATVTSIESLDALAIEIQNAPTKHDQNKSPNYERDNHRASDDWELKIYNDNINTRENVARHLVQITGRSELQAFRITADAQNTGEAVVDRYLRFEIAEAYNEGLRNQGIQSEIFPLE